MVASAVAVPDPRAIPPQAAFIDFPGDISRTRSLIEDACNAAVQLYATEKNQRPAQYSNLETKLQAIPNVSAERAKAIKELWEKLDDKRPKLPPTEKGFRRKTWEKVFGAPDENKPYVFDEAHQEHLRILLTAIALGEVGSLAFWAHRALDKSELRNEPIQDEKKKRSWNKSKEAKIKNPYPATTATLMLMNAILGPFEARSDMTIVQEILQDYEKISSPAGNANLSPNEEGQLQKDIKDVFKNHDELKTWLLETLEDFPEADAILAPLITKRQEEWRNMTKEEKDNLTTAFTKYDAPHMRQIAGTNALRLRLHGPFAEILPEVDNNLQAHMNPVRSFHENYMKRLGLRYRIDVRSIRLIL